MNALFSYNTMKHFTVVYILHVRGKCVPTGSPDYVANTGPKGIQMGITPCYTGKWSYTQRIHTYNY